MTSTAAHAARAVAIVGAGIFGITAAIELRRRRWAVSLFDPGPIPRDVAASTDLSKVVRMDYGADEFYTALGEAALAGWDLWNAHWGEPLYHEEGFLLLTREPMPPGGFERESFDLLRKRGHRLTQMSSARLKEQHPAWAAGQYPGGYFNPRGGWAESGRVVTRLAQEARALGGIIHEGAAFGRLLERGSRVTGLATRDGAEHRADCVLMATGAWTPTLLPHLAEALWATGQPVLHFQAPNLEDYAAPRFPVWAADIARTGWYGFPALANGILKIANHGPGRRVHPDEPRTVLPAEVERFRGFLRDSLPGLADAPVIGSRLCLYCDTADGDFWIDHDPQREGLVVAGGDSGHAFKFAPVLGGIIADVVERRPNSLAKRFRWRKTASAKKEGARHR